MSDPPSSPSVCCPTRRSTSRLAVFSAIPWRSHSSNPAGATSHSFELLPPFSPPPHMPLRGCHRRLQTQETPARFAQTAGLRHLFVRFSAPRTQVRSVQTLADAALPPPSFFSHRTSPAPR